MHCRITKPKGLQTNPQKRNSINKCFEINKIYSHLNINHYILNGSPFIWTESEIELVTPDQFNVSHLTYEFTTRD